jgi:hypothetical protein
MSVAIAAANPFRPADWRWQRALAIADGRGPRTTKRIDTPVGFMWIRRASRFLAAQRRAASTAAEMELMTECPDIFWANRIWHDPGPRRHSLEAHILARETDFEIGFRCGLPPATVDAYEALYFNVREKIQHPAYIYHAIFGDGPRRALTDNDPALLKMYGYILGPHVLSAVESGFAGASWCSTPDAVNAALQDDAIGTMKLKAAIAAKTVPVNSGTQLSLLEQFTKFVEIERTTDSAGKSQDQLIAHINAMFSSVPLSIAGFSPHTGKRLPATPLSEYDTAAMELTYSELMRVSVRRPIGDNQMIRSMRFNDAPDANAALPPVPTQNQ